MNKTYPDRTSIFRSQPFSNIQDSNSDEKSVKNAEIEGISVGKKLGEGGRCHGREYLGLQASLVGGSGMTVNSF